jgi:hypothetical protein
LAKKKWTVVIEWADGDVSDCDELHVYAETAAGATSKARKAWSRENLAKFPNLAIESVFVLTPGRLLELA